MSIGKIGKEGTVEPDRRVSGHCTNQHRRAGKRPHSPLLPPRRERIVERAFAGGAFFDRDDGAALVDVDQRHVVPGAFLQELQVARAVGVDCGQANHEQRQSLSTSSTRIFKLDSLTTES